MVTLERKREAVVFLKTKEVSERRSCQLILLARSTCQYRIRREPDEEFEQEVKELAFANPRYGYRRVHALLKRGGQTVNRKRVVRIWQKFAPSGSALEEVQEASARAAEGFADCFAPKRGLDI